MDNLILALVVATFVTSCFLWQEARKKAKAKKVRRRSRSPYRVAERVLDESPVLKSLRPKYVYCKDCRYFVPKNAPAAQCNTGNGILEDCYQKNSDCGCDEWELARPEQLIGSEGVARKLTQVENEPPVQRGDSLEHLNGEVRRKLYRQRFQGKSSKV